MIGGILHKCYCPRGCTRKWSSAGVYFVIALCVQNIDYLCCRMACKWIHLLKQRAHSDKYITLHSPNVVVIIPQHFSGIGKLKALTAAHFRSKGRSDGQGACAILEHVQTRVHNGRSRSYRYLQQVRRYVLRPTHSSLPSYILPLPQVPAEGLRQL